MSDGPPLARAVVIDYGAGNLRSVERALAAVGFSVRTVSGPVDVAERELLVLPGQGRFGQVMRAFKSSGFESTVRAHIAASRPFLGVCVGLQLLLEGSEEDPDEPGLGVLSGRVRRFPAGASVPQMGWNQIAPFGSGAFLAGVPSGSHVYFANSYYADMEVSQSDSLDAGATTLYGGVSFLSALSRGGLHATQFHPEKSQAVGLRMLANLARGLAEA